MCCDNKCLKLCIKCCQDEVVFHANLEATHNYVWIVTDSRGNEYAINFTTDANGNGTLLATSLPDSLFSIETNQITVRVKETVNDSSYVPMKITLAHECIELKFTGTKEDVGIELTA